MSVAGGVSKAVDRAVVHGCEALQVFTKTGDDGAGGRRTAEVQLSARQRAEWYHAVVSHAIIAATSRHVNSCGSSRLPTFVRDTILARSARAPRGHPIRDGRWTHNEALRSAPMRFAWSSARPRAKTMVLLEHTPTGRTAGHRCEHLAAGDQHVRGSRRVGVARHVSSRRVGIRTHTQTGYATRRAVRRLVALNG